jgi:SAM-dependent methyltransferase
MVAVPKPQSSPELDRKPDGRRARSNAGVGAELDRVLRDEADFANRDYAPYADQLDINPEMFQRYEAPSDLADWRQLSALLLGDLGGRTLLDFGCGMGEEAVYLAKLGAHVTAIDISEVGVEITRKRAEHHALPITAVQMRADPTRFADASFDRVHGLGILHHVGIESGLAEVWRVLKPGGVGVFLEPMGDSAVIESAKTWLMKHARFLGEFDHVTDHEHNLTWREIEAATRRFAQTTVFPYHLLYRLKRLVPSSWLETVRRIDAGLLGVFPSLRRYAGGVVIRVRK